MCRKNATDTQKVDSESLKVKSWKWVVHFKWPRKWLDLKHKCRKNATDTQKVDSESLKVKSWKWVVHFKWPRKWLDLKHKCRKNATDTQKVDSESLKVKSWKFVTRPFVFESVQSVFFAHLERARFGRCVKSGNFGGLSWIIFKTSSSDFSSCVSMPSR